MQKTISIRHLTACGLTAALISVCAAFRVPLPFSPVPVTLQLFAVLLGALYLDKKSAAVSAAVYCLMGAAGLPVFSGMQAGFGVLCSPTGGFLLGFIPGAYLTGAAAEALEKHTTGRPGPALLAIAAIPGVLAIYACGTAQYVLLTGSGPLAALTACVLPFLAPDALKIAMAGLAAVALRRAIPLRHGVSV